MGLQQSYDNIETNYVLEICPLLECFAAFSGKSLGTFRNTLKTGPKGCPKTSVRIYHYTLRDIPEQRGFRLLCDGSLKTRNFYTCSPSASRVAKARPHICHVVLTFWRTSPGWIIISVVLAVLASLLALFPKTLPRAAVRRMVALERQSSVKTEPELPASISGKTLRWCNTVSRRSTTRGF